MDWRYLGAPLERATRGSHDDFTLINPTAQRKGPAPRKPHVLQLAARLFAQWGQATGAGCAHYRN